MVSESGDKDPWHDPKTCKEEKDNCVVEEDFKDDCDEDCEKEEYCEEEEEEEREEDGEKGGWSLSDNPIEAIQPETFGIAAYEVKMHLGDHYEIDHLRFLVNILIVNRKMWKKTVEKGYLPGYHESLSDQLSKERYGSKLELIEGTDPYEIPKKEWKDDVELWPSVTYIDVGMYLLFSKSPYTEEELKNYKSLKCYQNFFNGWVREVLVKDFGERRLLIAKVNHSMRMSEKPLTPWIISHKDGNVLIPHCDCMAGLGESCSYDASLPWAFEAGAKKRDSLTVTDRKAYWVLPSAVKKVPYSKISDIVFSKYGGVNKKAKTESKVPISSHHEIVDFLSNVKAFCDSKPAVMALMKEFSDAYVPSSINEDLPPVLSTYFDKELSAAEYDTVQAQLFCTGRSYCDFIVWTEKSIYVERITADERFMKANLLKVKEFVTRCLIPEILSNWYSKSMGKCKGGKISRAE
ncbi:hypothetical protein AWC38_SpisGene17251 [Stylophora pistillata]|uniref:Uncharacterized protein n=1 Tax=Stylophora pistillata TaxID=50429 RepID=A0A2B4RNL1_STYPI|nr:hypothetical protein AWC38_SpisGene17251 [Stylophora pistillata]